jgi:CelD/BcsL family acetyltransferase involved in cellulose biosynthesis
MMTGSRLGGFSAELFRWISCISSGHSSILGRGYRAGLDKPALRNTQRVRLLQSTTGRDQAIPENDALRQVTLSDASDPMWLAYVQGHPDATAFHHPRWLELLASTYGYRPLIVTIRDTRNSIVAGLPLLDVRSWLTGRRLISLPFTDYCPPLGRDASDLTELASALSAWRRSTGQPRLEIRGAMPQMHGLRSVPAAVRHLLTLEPDVQRVASRFRKRTTGAVHKAQRAGVEVTLSRSQDGMSAFYRLHWLTHRRLGVPVQPQRFFEQLWRSVIEPELGFVLLAHRAGQPIAGAVYLSWNRNLIEKYAASDHRHVQVRPNNLICATAIEWGCRNGYRTLDFGRTDFEHEGLRRFKSSWGAVELPLEYSYLGAEPRRQQGGYVRGALSKVIQVSPPIVCRALGEALYGHFA